MDLSFTPLQEELRTIDTYIVRWATRKYKRFQGHTMATWDWLRSVKRRHPGLFAHWSLGTDGLMTGAG